MAMTKDQYFAASRHALSALGGMAVAFGLMKTTDVQVLIAAFEQISTAIGLIAAAGGAVAPIFSALWASKSAAPAAQLEKAVANNSIQAVLAKVANQPEVDQIIAPSVAATTPSTKVVG